MEAPNLENHCFSCGKTYFLRNPLFLYFAQKVIKNSIKKGTKIHEKIIKKRYEIEVLKSTRKGSKIIEKGLKMETKRVPKGIKNGAENGT